MDEFISLDLSNASETAQRTGESLETLRHLIGAAYTRHNYFIMFRLGEDSKWHGIEVPQEVSMEWLVTHLSRFER